MQGTISTSQHIGLPGGSGGGLERSQFGRSLMDRSEHGVEALGYVARYGAVVSALADVCERLGVASLRPALVTGSEENAAGVSVFLQILSS